MLAEYRWLFRDRLDASTDSRISQEIRIRMLDVALDWRCSDWWNTTGNNWNTVCNSNLVQTALYEIREPRELAAFVHPICRRMDYALDYFTPDGGCSEGVGYWEYGFGHFLDACLVIQHRTGGKVLLADDEHIRRICRFPLAVQLGRGQRATFADSANGNLSADSAVRVHKLYGIAELFRLVAAEANGLPAIESLRTLALYEGQQPDPALDASDCFLPDLGFAKAHGADDLVLAAIAGNNGVSHNHNDIGHFILLAGQTVFLTDPGSPVYNSKTFGPHRYEMLFCRSRGHSVPLINGREQQPGAQYVGQMQVVGFNADPANAKRIHIDLTRAYDDSSLQSLVREFSFGPDQSVNLTDSYDFSDTPASIEEAFVTFEKVELQPANHTAIIRGPESSLVLSASLPGEFTVQEFPPDVHEGQDRRALRRIAFTPAKVSRKLQLRFGFKLL